MKNNFIAAIKIKLGENLLKIILLTSFWCRKRYYKSLKGASANISILEIFSNYFRCQLIAPLFVKYSINSSRICFISIAALLPYFEFCNISPNMVYSLEDPGIRSTSLTMRVYFKMQIISTKRTALLLCTKHTAWTISEAFICHEHWTGVHLSVAVLWRCLSVTPYRVN